MHPAKYECDLHCHTNRSDGKDSPKELIDKAVSSKIKVIAITDHDMSPPDEIEADGKLVSTLDYAKSKGIELMRGIEVSCDTEIEDVHIIGFGCEFKDNRWFTLEQAVIKSKVESYQELVKLLSLNGYPLTWDMILNRNGNRIDETLIQKKMIFEMMADLGYTSSWKEAKVLVQKHPKLQVKRVKPDPKTIIDLIHQTHGIAILAHPYLIQSPLISTEDYIDALIEAGLDGIEASYGYSKTNYQGHMSESEIENIVRSKYQDKGLILSGGSDYHGLDIKSLDNQRELGCNGIGYNEFINYGLDQYLR
ncbi:MAG: PHP domain-containing protein [Erysipelotrichaceae bacterium]